MTTIRVSQYRLAGNYLKSCAPYGAPSQFLGQLLEIILKNLELFKKEEQKKVIVNV
jgi:hypothetical protein